MNSTSQYALIILCSLIIWSAFLNGFGYKHLLLQKYGEFIQLDHEYYLSYGGVSMAIESSNATYFERSKNKPTMEHELPTLAELVQSSTAHLQTCPNGSTPILDNIITNGPTRKIPRIIHITSKNRCTTPAVHAVVNQWRLNGHSLYFHDDAAVERLTSHPLSQSVFPLLNETLKCVTNGATKSDLWRYLVLYFYGGIYTDIDNTPTGFNENSISDEDDSFFVIEALGIISQFFIASSPHHPLMKLSLERGLNALRGTVNVMRNNPSRTTGPAALKNGFIQFMNNTSDGYVDAGTYVGIDNRSVTAIGIKTNPREYINRGGLSDRDKMKHYAAMGMEHFHSSNIYPNAGRISCMEHLIRTNGTNKIAKYGFNKSMYFDISDAE